MKTMLPPHYGGRRHELRLVSETEQDAIMYAYAGFSPQLPDSNCDNTLKM